MNLEWAKEWLSLFGADTLDEMLRFYADAFEHVDVTVGHRSTTPAELRAFYASFMASGSVNRFVPTAYLGSAEAGAVSWTWTVHHRGRLFDLDVEGKTTELSGVSTLRFRDGKIVWQHDYWDLATMLRQLGTPVPGLSG